MFLEVGFLPGIHSNGTDRESRPAIGEVRGFYFVNYGAL